MFGLSQTGKSFLLNRLFFNSSIGFPLASIPLNASKGIWIWGKPLKIQRQNSETLTVLLLDTHGLSFEPSGVSQDCQLFSLAALLSSTLIYNSFGGINEPNIKNFSFLNSLNRHIKAKSDELTSDLDDYSKYFPHFLWIMRDFEGGFIDSEGESIPTRDYMDLALQPQKGYSERIEASNKIRRLIQALFKQRDCFGLPKPSKTEKDLQIVIQMPPEKLSQEFTQKISELSAKVINSIEPKTFRGRLLSGVVISRILREITDAWSAGQLPILNRLLLGKQIDDKQVEKEDLLLYEQSLLSRLASRFDSFFSPRMKNQEYRSFYEFEKDLKAFQKYFEDLEQNFMIEGKIYKPKKIMEKFLNKKLLESSEEILKKTEENYKDMKDGLETKSQDVREEKRRLHAERSEFEKEKALLIQKIGFCEESRDEMVAKIEQQEAEIMKMRKEFEKEIREKTDAYDEDIHAERRKKQSLLEQLRELKEKSSMKTQELESKLNELTERETELINRCVEAERQLNDLRDELTRKKNREKEAGDLNKSMQEQYSCLQSQMAIVSSSVSEKDITIKGLQAAFEKDKAVLFQETQFMESQVNELKQQLEDQRKINEATISALRSHKEAEDRPDVSKAISDLKLAHEKEKNGMKNENEKAKRLLWDEIDRLRTEIEHLESAKTSEAGSLKAHLGKAQSDLADCRDEKEKLLEQVRESERAKLRLLKEAEDRFNFKVSSLEEELESERDTHVKEIREIQNAAEAAVRELKEFFGAEKEKLEARMNEERQKNEEKLSSVIEEFEERMQEEQREHDDELEKMDEQLKGLEMKSLGEIQQLEKELGIMAKELESTKENFEDVKSRLGKLEEKYSRDMERTVGESEKERKELNGKIEKLMIGLNSKERELFGISKAKENTENALKVKEEEIKERMAGFDEQKKKLEKKLSEVTSKYEALSEEYMEKSRQYVKESALLEQNVTQLLGLQ